MSGFGPLVDAGWLAEHLSDHDMRVIDLRWYLDGRSGRDAYHAGHIPGAAFVDLEKDITGADGAGRHPLPAREQFEQAMRRAGVNAGDAVVVYDDQGGYSAARLWWLLRLFGHERAAVLDGGIDAWSGGLETGSKELPQEGDFVAGEPDRSLYLTYDEMTRDRARVALVDARAPERYRGEVEPIDPKPGHIPGARNVPWTANLGADKRFLPPERLRGKYAAAGVADGAAAVAYCGSGVSAVVDVLGMELAGFDGVRLYAGSWSDWVSHPEAPVATGEEAPPRG
jgi:thiosulfate/3-mercaptopyruvate sulfurtransferase